MNNYRNVDDSLDLLKRGASLLVVDFIRWKTDGSRQELSGQHRSGCLVSIRNNMLYLHHGGVQVLRTSSICRSHIIGVAQNFWMVFQTASGSEYWIRTATP